MELKRLTVSTRNTERKIIRFNSKLITQHQYHADSMNALHLEELDCHVQNHTNDQNRQRH